MMSRRVMITGATGVVGAALSKQLILQGMFVCGIARKRPGWWPLKEHFLEMDLQHMDLAGFAGMLSGYNQVFHLCDLARVDVVRNRTVAHALYKEAQDAGVERFFYASSIRVYSGLCGTVDEKTDPFPALNDIYGCCKSDIEKDLIHQAQKGGPLLVVLRLGNIFSCLTPEKCPRREDRLTRWIYRAKNHHLISDAHAALAVSYLATEEKVRYPIEIVNITQEAAGENDYFFLSDQLAGLKNCRPDRLTALGKKLRFHYCRLKKELSAEYYNTVLEKRLLELDIKYPTPLSENVLAIYGENVSRTS